MVKLDSKKQPICGGDAISFAWEDGFPKGYGHTSLSYLKHCKGFEEAKNGDMNAAIDVVKKCVKTNRLQEFRAEYSDSFLLPVRSRNMLPLALSYEIGLKIWDQVFLKSTIHRKSLYAIQRLQHSPVFVGHIQKDMTYIIVDDIVTQGGTISALRKHVLAYGGKVAAIVALAYAIGSYDIAPTRGIMVRLLVKFGDSICQFQSIGLVNSFDELTNSQAKYLLRFSSIHNIFKKIAKYNRNHIIKQKYDDDTILVE